MLTDQQIADWCLEIGYATPAHPDGSEEVARYVRPVVEKLVAAVRAECASDLRARADEWGAMAERAEADGQLVDAMQLWGEQRAYREAAARIEKAGAP